MLQADFLATNKAEFKLNPRHSTGNLWAWKLISLLWLATRAHWDLRNADCHDGQTKTANHDIPPARLLKSITALHDDAPLMLATDRDVLPAKPVPADTMQNPALLEFWAKRTRTIVTRSNKADAWDAIHRTHECITHCFRHRRKKAPATEPTPPDTQPTPHTTATTHHKSSMQTSTNETDSEKPGPN
jgi:hypothetical protein